LRFKNLTPAEIRKSKNRDERITRKSVRLPRYFGFCGGAFVFIERNDGVGIGESGFWAVQEEKAKRAVKKTDGFEDCGIIGVGGELVNDGGERGRSFFEVIGG
jgi:hypothetical protein